MGRRRFAYLKASGKLCLIVLTCIPAGLNGRQTTQIGSSNSTAGLSLEQRGDLCMSRKLFREAVEAYSRIAPPTAETLNKLGIAYQQQFDHAEALKYYKRAIKISPQYAEAINNLGTVYYMHRDYRRATALYKRALALRPQSATMHINLGMAWLARHRDADFQRNLQQALALDPWIFERIGSGQGVQIEERNPTDRAKFDVYMARFYARTGKNSLALQYIRKALESGWKERKELLEDEAFASIRGLPEFSEVMKLPPKAM